MKRFLLSIVASLASIALYAQAPAAPTVSSPVTYCVGQTADQLTAQALTGYELLWYTAATGGTGSTTAPTPSTSSIGTTSYYVSQKLVDNSTPPTIGSLYRYSTMKGTNKWAGQSFTVSNPITIDYIRVPIRHYNSGTLNLYIEVYD